MERTKHFQYNLELYGRSSKDSSKNGELIVTEFEPGINLPILHKTFTFSSKTVRNVWPIRKLYYCIIIPGSTMVLMKLLPDLSR